MSPYDLWTHLRVSNEAFGADIPEEIVPTYGRLLLNIHVFRRVAHGDLP